MTLKRNRLLTLLVGRRLAIFGVTMLCWRLWNSLTRQS